MAADPDVRLLLANERTLLAWVRTSVTLQAGGVGLLAVAPSLDLGRLIGLALILTGAGCGVAGSRRHRAADEAIRRGELPPPGRAPQLVTAVVTVLALLLFLVALLADRG